MQQNLLSLVPKKYRPYVSDFHNENEDDSYWLSLDPDGEYHLRGYVAEYTVHEDTVDEVLEILCQHIEKKISRR